MRTSILFKLWVASLCAVLACWLPQSLAKPHEIDAVPVRSYKPVQALPMPKAAPFTGLGLVAVPAPPTAVYTGTGDANLDYIVQHESSGNPYAVNPIGACGLGQALPCSKMGCALSDVSCQIAWIRAYALDRYGSTAAAAAYWSAHRNW